MEEKPDGRWQGQSGWKRAPSQAEASTFKLFDISELNDNDNEESEPERWDGDAGETEDEVKAGDDGEPEEPEPQEEEHLLHRQRDCQRGEK